MEYAVAGSNIFIREMALRRAGEVVHGHAHTFAHTTYVTRGAVRIERLGPDGQVERAIEVRAADGLNWALIRAGVCHRITALEDDSMAHCIYAHRTPQGDVVQEYTGWHEATV